MDQLQKWQERVDTKRTKTRDLHRQFETEEANRKKLVAELHKQKGPFIEQQQQVVPISLRDLFDVRADDYELQQEDLEQLERDARTSTLEFRTSRRIYSATFTGKQMSARSLAPNAHLAWPRSGRTMVPKLMAPVGRHLLLKHVVEELQVVAGPPPLLTPLPLSRRLVP